MEQAALFVWFMVLACTTTLVQCTNKSIFILSGQSNMIGVGGVTNGVWDRIVPQECQSNPQILRLNNDSQWEIAREPLHQGIGQLLQGCGIGPGMPFANSVLKPGETIGLVPWAVGGTHIDQWQRGTSNYNQIVTRAQAAVSNGGGVIRAMLWFQGESDTYKIQYADAYKGKLVQFFNNLRDDLRSPSLPIFQVALVGGGMFLDTVREAQLNTGLPNVYCVDARKLNVTIQKNDTYYVHLDTPSQVKLGKAFATAFHNISALV